MSVSQKEGEVYVGDRSLGSLNTVGISSVTVPSPAQGEERRK